MKKPSIAPEPVVTCSTIDLVQSKFSESTTDSQGTASANSKSRGNNRSETHFSLDFDSLPGSGFVRLPTLLILLGCSRATVWRWVRAKRLPAPCKLGPRLVAWNVSELRQALSAYMKGEIQ